METIDPFASRDIAGISRWRPLVVLGAFCADIAATSNRTAAMYFMNEVLPTGDANERYPSLNSIT
jgi:hypothetical protein